MSTVVAPELKELEVALTNLTWSEFTSFSVQLGLENHTLRKIEQEKRDTSEKVRAVLQSWLDNDLEASWEKVVCCLEVVEKKVLAAGLKKKYCTKETSTLLKSGYKTL